MSNCVFVSPKARRRKYKRLKQKLKQIKHLKLLQHKRILTNEEQEKLNKEHIYQQQVKEIRREPHKQAAPTPPNNIITIGSYAFLKDLIRFQKYNGKVVKILQYLELKQRYKVRILPKHTQYFLVRFINISPIKESVTGLKEKKIITIIPKQYIYKSDHGLPKIIHSSYSTAINLSINQKRSFLIFGYVHTIIEPLISRLYAQVVPDGIVNVILYYTSLIPVINIESVEENEDHNGIDCHFMDDISVYDSMKIFKRKILDLYWKKWRNLHINNIGLWFKFGNVNKLLYPLTINGKYDYDYNRLVRIPPDEEDNIKLGDIGIVGKLDIIILLEKSRFDVKSLQIGDFVRIYSIKYGWLDSVIKYIKSNNVYIHYIGYGAKYDEIIHMNKLMQNGITEYKGY